MKKNGFTLVELLVVISIITTLSVIGLVSYSNIQSKARDRIRKDDLIKLATALEAYAQTNNGLYISGINNCPANTDTASTFYSAIQSAMPGSSLPKDPKTQALYCYISNNGSTYTLCARLENTTDSDINNPAVCPGYNFGLVPKS